MAAASPLQDLQERVMCPICLEPFKDPVVTPCGHNFCRPCFQGYLEGPWARVDFRLQSMVGLLGELSVQQEGTNRGPGAPLCCPKCQTPCLWADLRPNTELQNMVAVMRHLSVLQERHPMGGGVCVQHEEKLKLFCQDDHKLICVICQVSGEHEKHRVRPVSEAAQEYQAKLQNLLLPLKKERKEIVLSRQKEEEEYKDLRKRLEAERVEIIADFQHFRQLLREEEQTILRRLEEMDRKITMVENASIAKLYNQISSLDSLIKEIETKCKQPPEELLKDVGLTLSRCEKVRFHGPDLINKDNSNSENLKLQTYNDEEKNIACGNMNIVHPGDVKRYKVLVTLDPETAHQSLFLSENEQRVTRLHKMQFEFSPSNAKRFTASSCVLGRNGFSSGKHYWEVQLLQEELGWTVGIAHESVNRNLSTPTPQRTFGFNYFGQTSSADRFGEGHPESPAVGVLAVHGDNGRYVALTSPCTILKPLQPPKKLGVYLDCEQVQVSLYNGDTMELLYTLNGISFTGKVYPYFNLTGNNYAGRMLGIATDLRLV